VAPGASVQSPKSLKVRELPLSVPRDAGIVSSSTGNRHRCRTIQSLVGIGNAELPVCDIHDGDLSLGMQVLMRGVTFSTADALMVKAQVVRPASGNSGSVPAHWLQM